MENLKVAFIQSELYWQDKEANLAMFEEKIWLIGEKVDLIILPEMFNTGFTMDVGKMGEPMNLNTTKWMKQMAAQTKAVLSGSFIVKEAEKVFNRLLWVTPDGEVKHYDKRHLFRMANEHKFFDMGQKNLILELKGWKILPQVCYDLRFPVWTRNLTGEGELAYDFCYYIASWPAARATAWDILLKARAIENLCYIIGVNRVGVDGNNIAYSGHSGCYDFKGETLIFSEEKEESLIVELDFQQLNSFREKFPAWKDADPFNIKP